ncbi:MAG TPA: HAD family hydrolase [Burkholderiaceae bacterium]|nr:HAD family hydrolase [Burkholderiaceae bacterium]
MATRAALICFDLDGTLLDVRVRHYSVYRDVLRRVGGEPIDPEVYWQLKRAGETWDRLLTSSGLSPDRHPDFMCDFAEAIEAPDYLRSDTLFPDVETALEEARTISGCVIVSLRKRFDTLIEQVRSLGLSERVDAILEVSTSQPGALAKARAVRLYSSKVPLAVVGDTELDIAAARELGCPAIAVSRGLRTSELLAAARPESVVDSVNEAVALIRSRRR